MAGFELTDLTADTSPSSSDLGYSVKDPGGTPLDRKVTWLDVLKGASLGVLTTNGDLFTRATGALTRITRADLAADSAFTSLYAPIAVSTVQFSQPTHGSTRASSTMGSLNNAWSDTVTTTASLPRVKYNLAFSAQADGDTLVLVALACGGTIMDRGGGYLGGTNRETRVVLSGIHNPGAASTYTYEVYAGSLGAETITVSSTIDTTTSASLTADGVSSLQLQPVAVA